RLRGQLFLRLPDLPNADEALTRALARNPDSRATRVALARLRLVEHEALEAIELLAPATTAGSGAATALVTLGRAQQQARRFDQALATFTRATLGDASGEAREEAWYGRSLAALAGGMPDEAVSAMAELQQIAPAARWYFRRARDLWAAGHDALA